MKRLVLMILIGMVALAMLSATTSRYIIHKSFVLSLELASPSPTPVVELASEPVEEISTSATDLAVASDATASPQVLPAALESNASSAVVTSTAEGPSPAPSPTITPEPTATATATSTAAAATASVTATASATATAVEESPTVVPTASVSASATAQATTSPSESIPTPSAPDSTANGESGP